MNATGHCTRDPSREHCGRTGSRHAGQGRQATVSALTAALIMVAASMASVSPAWAHGNGETKEGYMLVQQALGHLAHDTGQDGVMAAMEKVDDALATQDQEGVNVVELKQARAKLDAGQVEQGRALLGQSISQALDGLMPATGEQTGTKLVAGELPGRGALTGRDWFFLAAAVLLLVGGAGLVVRYRPPDNVRALRRRLQPGADPPGAAPPVSGEVPEEER